MRKQDEMTGISDDSSNEEEAKMVYSVVVMIDGQR
jgi:hypothetical protein